MNEFTTPTMPVGGVIFRNHVIAEGSNFDTCPSCAGVITVRATADGGVEDFCEVCGNIEEVFQSPVQEEWPTPVKKKDAGVAPAPLGFGDAEKLEVVIEGRPMQCSST